MTLNKFRVAFSNAFRMQTLIENKLTVSALQQKALYSHENGTVQSLSIDKPIVVSLTTYGKKIYEVYLVVESIFQHGLLGIPVCYRGLWRRPARPAGKPSVLHDLL